MEGARICHGHIAPSKRVAEAREAQLRDTTSVFRRFRPHRLSARHANLTLCFALAPAVHVKALHRLVLYASGHLELSP